MLLRRITEHVRAQSWLAVALDLLVVVVGIFLGLQVDGWNEARKERAREQAYLEQIHTDFEKTIKQIEFMAEFHAMRATDLDWLVDSITSGELAEDDERRFRNAFISMYQLPPLGATMGVYEAMKASADLALIRDQRIKSCLVSLDTGLEVEASLLNYFRDMSQADADLTRGLALVVANEDRSESSLRVDFSEVVEDRYALTVVAGQERTHNLFGEMRGELGERFTACRALIAEQLG
jgi:hypothetical protein